MTTDVEKAVAAANANWSAMHTRVLDEIRTAAGLPRSATVPEIVARIEAIVGQLGAPQSGAQGRST
jgi:hypothetical protein